MRKRYKSEIKYKAINTMIGLLLGLTVILILLNSILNKLGI